VGKPTACVDSALNTDWTLDEVPYNFTDVGKNRPIPPNEHFTVSWTLKNTGTCTWDSSYVIAFVSGYRMTQSASHPIVVEGITIAPGSAAPSVRWTPPPFSVFENGGGRTLILKKIVFINTLHAMCSPKIAL
jgi:hypothetical protein